MAYRLRRRRLSDLTHSFSAGGSLVAMLFVEPECFEGRWFRRSLPKNIIGRARAVRRTAASSGAPGAAALDTDEATI